MEEDVADPRTRMVTCLLAAACVIVAALVPAHAEAADGDLSYVDCITSGVTTSAACSGAKLPTNRLESVVDTVVSPDGKSVYAASQLHDTVTHFERNVSTGALTVKACHSAKNPDFFSCTSTAGATANGADSGMDQPWALAVSADGKSLYLASLADDAVAHFSRNTANGNLTYSGCISSEAESAGCTQAPGGLGSPYDIEVAPNGKAVYVAANSDDVVTTLTRDAATGALSYLEQSGEMVQPRAVAVSPDSRSVYVGSANDDSVTAFNAEPATGDLTFLQCITGNTIEDNCVPLQSATFQGSRSGLAGPTSIEVSPDGRSVYVVAQTDDAVARFARSTQEHEYGGIAFSACISGNGTGSGPPSSVCMHAPGADVGAQTTGMQDVKDLAVGPDGKTLHVVSPAAGAVTTIGLPSLAHRGCISGRTESTVGNGGHCIAIPSATSGGNYSGLDDLNAITVSPDGKNAYAAAHDDDAIAIFARTPAGGFDPDPDPDPGPGPGPGGDKEVDAKGAAKGKQKGTTVKVKVSCAEACTAKASGNIIAKPKKGKRAKTVKAKLQAQKRKLKAGKSATLKLKPKGKAKRSIARAMKKGAKTTAKVNVVITDAAGNKKKQKLRIKLKK